MMSEFQYNPLDRAGWEEIWRMEDLPPRFRSFASPNDSVVAWAETVVPGGRILDVGCGVGRHVIYLGGRGFQMAGTDISPTGVKVTQDAAAGQNIPFDGRVSDMTTLPWPDATFDAAFSTSTIHHHLRVGIMQTLAEVWRVLKPGGLFLVDFPSTDTLTYQTLRELAAAEQVAEVEPNTFVDERNAEDVDGFLPHHFCDETDIGELLREFQLVRLYPALREVVTESGPGKIGKWVAWVRKPVLK